MKLKIYNRIIQENLWKFPKLDYNYVKCFHINKDCNTIFKMHRFIWDRLIKVPFPFCSTILLLVPCKSKKEYFKVRYLLWLENND